ncbi:23S rRNA (adenine(1618)-N(6))-methyltransferase RlmF [Sulfitobacter guttiformis]|uniref:Ribosomal RNA large subunit methyltransferase F n=1 Tax=Sulfitobacter guttiformis TaxID=74349 RepID=A0A420DTV2_9RHOB|nr:23S rRNA (adenine(1618)-N(6))-methyltransferase RlmF [Sulfitobacter guttiformis]KIN71121.1 Ribosomal RNA large subunit methyltransferase F [Sulfitobacter guttiformis KCTC 32187]RKE97603.1 23S rRNA m(6)A-1618 methyltransferase [Sulfitobacter guttiformis]
MAPNPKLHPRNQHIEGYDFTRLVAQTPELEKFTIRNPRGQRTVNFQDAKAVRMLNRALLKTHYNIDFWDIPEGYLCPPIPGRVDYIHYLADLLADSNSQIIPRGGHIKALDIGTGASLVYPLTGQSEYGWSFTGVDIDTAALESARQISDENNLNVTLRRQIDPENIFIGAIEADDFFHLSMCNPPFHSSLEKAGKGTQRKWASLGKGRSNKLNFGGQHAELWCPGGEIGFIARMVEQSKSYKHQCLWFTSLVSKKDNLQPLNRILGRAKVDEFKIVEMAQGQKTSRFIAWTYIRQAQRSSFAASVGTPDVH